MRSSAFRHDGRMTTNTDITFSDILHAGRHGISRAEARDRRIRAAVEIGWDDLRYSIYFAAVREAFVGRSDRPYDFEEEGITPCNGGGALYDFTFHDSWDPDAEPVWRDAYITEDEVMDVLPYTFYDDMLRGEILDHIFAGTRA